MPEFHALHLAPSNTKPAERVETFLNYHSEDVREWTVATSEDTGYLVVAEVDSTDESSE